MAGNPEEADEWVNILQNNVLGNPVLHLIRKRKGQLTNRKSTNASHHVNRNSPAFSPPLSSISSSSASSSSHKPAAMLPTTIDPTDVDINLSPPPSPPSSSNVSNSNPLATSSESL